MWGTAQSDKGRNQAWFEFTSQLAELIDMDFVGLPVYRWGAAGGHALRMAARLTGRGEVLYPALARPRAPGRVPHLLRAAARCAGHIDAGRGRGGPATAASTSPTWSAKMSDRTAAVYFDNPGFLGVIETDGARSPSSPTASAPR